MSGLPKGWVEARLSEVCELITDGTHHSPANGAVGEFKYVTAKNIRKNGLDLTHITYVDRVTHREIYKRCPVKLDDVLYIKDGATTGLAIVNPLDEEFSMLSSVALIRPRGTLLNAQFLRHQLNSRSVKERMTGDMTGSAIRRLTLTTIGRQEVAVPPLAEQKRIVAKLEALNAKSARARIELARIETLVSRYKQAVLSKAFSGELTREWRGRLKLTEPRVGKLEELLSIPVRNGLSIKGSDTPPGFPALKLSALRGREVRLDDVRYIPVDDERARRFLIESGDILVSRGNGTRSLVGIASIVPAVARPTIFPDTAFRMRVNDAKALPLWLTSLWNAPQVRSQIERVAKTTAGIWKISQTDLTTIQLSLPSTLEEQHEIVRRIETAFARIDRLAAQAKRALELVGKLDEAILVKAFRGELVPQDENDEPADRLLARIRAERQAAPKAKRGRGAKA